MTSTPETGGLVCQFQHPTLCVRDRLSLFDVSNIAGSRIFLQIIQKCIEIFTVFLMQSVDKLEFCKFQYYLGPFFNDLSIN
jgi:hypothetical protein